MALSSMDALPREIISDIISKLPVKSIVRFRCVSKPWLEFITYSRFPYWVLKLNQDCNHKQDCLHKEKSIILHVYKRREIGGSDKLYSIGGGMEEKSFMLAVEIDSPLFVGHPFKLKTGSCDGMVCVGVEGVEDESLILWNPTTRDHKVLPLPSNEAGVCSGVCGLGLDLSIDDYKVVSVCKTQVFVFSVKRNFWRYVGDFPLFLSGQGVPLNGCLYWAAGKRKSISNVVVCFDLANETFHEVPHPPFDARQKLRVLLLGKSLGVFQEFEKTLWMMNEKVPNTEEGQDIWTKTMTLPRIVKFPDVVEPVGDDPAEMILPFMHRIAYSQMYPMCFTKRGKLLLSVADKMFVLYDPTNKETYEQIKIPGLGPYHDTVVYAESLISPDSIKSMNDID